MFLLFSAFFGVIKFISKSAEWWNVMKEPGQHFKNHKWMLHSSFFSVKCKADWMRGMRYLISIQTNRTLCHHIHDLGANLKEKLKDAGPEIKLQFLPLDRMIFKLSDRDQQDRKSWCVESESLWFTGSKVPSPLLLETGQGWGKCLARLLPTPHCYPAQEGSHCWASSLSLTTSVNKDLNNKQRNASLCVMVSFTGFSFSSALAT